MKLKLIQKIDRDKNNIQSTFKEGDIKKEEMKQEKLNQITKTRSARLYSDTCIHLK